MEQSPNRRWRRLRIEPLEDRRLLAALTVNSASDVTLAGDGFVTLREAIAAANANTTTDLGHTGSGADAIVFDPAAFATPQTLALVQGEMAITEALTLSGPSRTLLTIDGQLQSRIFNITATTGEVTIEGMTLTRGKTTGVGGAIRSLANLTVDQSTVSGNKAFGDGGGIYIRRNAVGSSLSVTNSSVTGNTSINSSGGGIFAATNLEVENSTISGNTTGTSSSPEEGPRGSGVFLGGTSAQITAEIIDSTISGNNGGRADLFSYGGPVTLQDSTMSGVFAIGDVTATGSSLSDTRGFNVTIQSSIVNGFVYASSVATIIGSTGAGSVEGYDRIRLIDTTLTGGIDTLLFGRAYLENSSCGTIEASAVTLTNSTSGSITASGGQGIGPGEVTLSNSTVGRVTSTNGNIYADGSHFSAGISNNGDESGGAISLTNSTVTGGINKLNRLDRPISLINTALTGGGIYSYCGDISLFGSTITGSTGRGISQYPYSEIPSDVTITNSTIKDNGGNGISIGNGHVRLINSTVSGNSAVDIESFPLFFYNGGGIRAPEVTLINSTVSGNTAERDGGGIWARRITIEYSTVTGNDADGKGGGIYLFNSGSEPYVISSSIIAGNSAGVSNPDIKLGSGTLTLNYSLIGNKSGTTLTEAQTSDANGNLIGNSAGGGVIDPLLGPLANNGGPTETHALLPGSPAIDARSFVVVDPEQPTPTHNYQLNGSLADALGGPSLVALGGTLTATGYQFGPNQGLNLSSALVDPADYSIELVFSWNSLSGGWQKIIDFDNLVSDVGLYTLGNGLQFMNGAFTPNLFTAGVARHLVLTRDDATNVVRAYIDGVERWNFVDTAGEAVFDGPNDIIRFFQDDTASGQTEAQSGFVDRIRIFDGALNATQVAALFSPPPPPPGVPANDQRGAPFARVFNGAIDMGAIEVQPPASYGDFNEDRLIDAADYVVYRKFLGTSVPSYSFADSDGNGSITPADDDPWKRNFGSVLDVMSPGSGAALAYTTSQSVAANAIAPTSLTELMAPMVAAVDTAMMELALTDMSPKAHGHDMRPVSRTISVPSTVAGVRLLHLLDGPTNTSRDIENDHSPERTDDVNAEHDTLFAGLYERISWFLPTPGQ